MIRNIKETFPPKTGMRKSSKGYVREVRDPCCIAACCSGIFIVVVTDVRDGSSNYIVYPNSNYSNWEILQINALNNMKLQIKALYLFELGVLQIRQQLNCLRICGTSN